MDEIINKGYKTEEDLLREIREIEPDFNPPTNIVNLRAIPDLTNIVPVEFEEMEKESPKAAEFVISPFLQVGGIAFIYAATGLGKTLFTLNLAYAMAGGGNFLKYQCPKPRRVLYVDGEMAYSQLHARIMQIAKQQGELNYKKNLLFINPAKLLPFRVPMIDDRNGQEIYAQLLTKYDIDVLILDNFSMLTSFDENKSNEFKVVQDWQLYLRSLGKTIINVHHSGKDKTGYRGSSRILDYADTAISLQPIEDETLEEENFTGKKFKIVYQKARNFGGKDAIPFEANFEQGIWSYQSSERKEMDRVIEMYNLGMTQTAIALELHCGQSKVAKMIKKARLTGIIPA